MKKRFLAGVTALCLSLTLLPARVLASGAGSPQKATSVPNPDSFRTNEDFKPYDPHYPKKDQYGEYVLRVPDLKGRLTFKESGKNQTTGTLFAPGVSASGGWKNATKKWYNYDSGLCFAASASNLLSWYLNRYHEVNPGNNYGFETEEEDIFNHFRSGWDPDTGGDPIEALSWYFTGGFPSNNPNPSSGVPLTGRDKGAHLRMLPNNTCKHWAWISFNWDPQVEFDIYGSYEDQQFPYIEWVRGISGNDPFATWEGFSQHVIRQLHYGPTVISIIPETGANGHAITLWGADYDVESGLITKIHVTDSDDAASAGLLSVPIVREPNGKGFRMVNYPYHPPTGAYQKFTRIRDSVMMYAPDVVRANRAYTGETAVISELQPDSDGSGVRVQVSNLPGDTLEYGYSYDQNAENVAFWQSGNHFTGLQPDLYYFFARVKETSDHAAGGVSAPSAYRVKTPSPDAQQPAASLSLGTSGFRPFHQAQQYIWYGAEDGQAEPILWRVLDEKTSVGADGLFLISDKLYGTGTDGGVQFSQSGNDYQNSKAQQWCRDFEKAHLSAAEQAALLATTKTDAPYAGSTAFAGAQNILSNDKVFLPSAEEISKESYGFGTEQSRRARYHRDFSGYWLRSPSETQHSHAGYVDKDGRISSQSTDRTFGARPAFNLDGSQVLYAAAVSNVQGANFMGLNKIHDVDSADFRLVLKDTSRDFRVTTSELTLQPGEAVTLAYTGAQTSQNGNEYISVILTDAEGTTPLYYGKLAPAQSADGEIRFDLPQELPDGTYVLKVFNERYSSSKETGASSPFCDVTLTLRQEPVLEPIPEVNLTLKAPVKGQQPENAVAGETGYTVEKTTWLPEGSEFQPDTAYTVSIELKAEAGHIFTDGTVFTLNSEKVTAVLNGDTCVITYDGFPKTDPNPDPDPNNGSGGETPAPDNGSHGENNIPPAPDSGNGSESTNKPTPDTNHGNGSSDSFQGDSESKPQLPAKPSSQNTTTNRPEKKPSDTVISQKPDSDTKDDSADTKPDKTEASKPTEPQESTPVTMPSATSQETEQAPEHSSLGWILLVCAIPVVGLVVFFILKEVKSKKK